MTDAADLGVMAGTSGLPHSTLGSGPRDAPVAYGAEAGLYDMRTALFQGCRERIVTALDARAGDVVLDVGCGTGLCFDGLRRGVGTDGLIVGIDESGDMVELARGRVASRGWENVAVLHAPADRAQSPVAADKALFCAVHDVLQSADALRNVLAQLRPGARVVAGGGKLTSGWYGPLNAQVMALHRPYVRSFDGFAKPWHLLAQFLTDLEVTEFSWGTGFCAVGRLRDDLPSAPAISGSATPISGSATPISGSATPISGSAAPISGSAAPWRTPWR